MNGHSSNSEETAKYGPSSSQWEAFCSRDSFLGYIYHTGFLSANFADTFLVLHNSLQPFPTFSLHALIIARSPKFFEHLKRASGPPYHLHLEASDPNLTVEGVNIALASLYHGRKDVAPSLSVGVLAAANLFQLQDLGRTAWQSCLSLFKSKGGLKEGIRFASTAPHGVANGTSSPTLAIDGPYPHYTTGLLPALLSYLISEIHDPQMEAILLELPFVLLKSVLESEELQMGSMERHTFARTIVQKRKKSMEPGVEESVVMAFGTDSKSGGIEVLRKDKSSRKKALWKANANGR